MRFVHLLPPLGNLRDPRIKPLAKFRIGKPLHDLRPQYFSQPLAEWALQLSSLFHHDGIPRGFPLQDKNLIQSD
jgi:hypothetical protein